MMEAGGHVKTFVHRITYFWETLGDSRDFKFSSEVGQWVAKNEKVLDKKRETEVVRLLHEQFPALTHVETKDDHGRLARWVK
jgi:hypothetical protein